MNLELNGKSALVMGASGGIGKEIARALIAEGCRVCLNSRSEEKLAKTSQEIGADSYIPCDLSVPGSGTNVVKQATQKLGGPIDILVLNTGGPKKGSFLEVSDQQWHEDFQSLWMTPVEAMREVLPQMSERRYGRILFVTSIAAIEPLPGLTTSNGLRAGLPGLAKSISDEYAHQGITLNLLLPGYTNTERIQNLNLSEDKIKQMVPAGRLGDPKELAQLACFLSSPLGGYINAQSIAVDGGVLRSHF